MRKCRKLLQDFITPSTLIYNVPSRRGGIIALLNVLSLLAVNNDELVKVLLASTLLFKHTKSLGLFRSTYISINVYCEYQIFQADSPHNVPQKFQPSLTLEYEFLKTFFIAHVFRPWYSQRRTTPVLLPVLFLSPVIDQPTFNTIQADR